MEYNSEVESVIGFDALYESMLKCKKGVAWKDSVAAFCMRATERIIKLCEDLHTGKYKPSPPKYFTITSPKKREIASISFRDRVYQRSLNDNIVYPTMSRSFIYDNFACQKDKGTDAARERLKYFLRNYYIKNKSNDLYVAQFDIHGYYPNMDHQVAEDIFMDALSPWAFSRVQQILHDQYTGDKGYNPGSQLVQIAGISVLNGLDHFIKEQLHVKYYIRYMDDFILIHPNKEYLEWCKEKIVDYLSNLKFTINEKKTLIYPIANGIPFLGFNFYLTNTGKVLMLIKSESIKRQRKKLFRMVKRAKAGIVTREKVNESYQAWRNHASKGNSYKLLQRMDKYYNNLWR